MNSKTRLPSEAKSKKAQFGNSCEINRTGGGDHFNCSGQKGEGIEVKGPAVTVEQREKLDKQTETPGTYTQKPSSSFEGHRLADIHIHCSHLIIPFCNVR